METDKTQIKKQKSNPEDETRSLLERILAAVTPAQNSGNSQEGEVAKPEEPKTHEPKDKLVEAIELLSERLDKMEKANQQVQAAATSDSGKSRQASEHDEDAEYRAKAQDAVNKYRKKMNMKPIDYQKGD